MYRLNLFNVGIYWTDVLTNLIYKFTFLISSIFCNSIKWYFFLSLDINLFQVFTFTRETFWRQEIVWMSGWHSIAWPPSTIAWVSLRWLSTTTWRPSPSAPLLSSMMRRPYTTSEFTRPWGTSSSTISRWGCASKVPAVISVFALKNTPIHFWSIHWGFLNGKT